MVILLVVIFKYWKIYLHQSVFVKFAWSGAGYHMVNDNEACRDEFYFINPSLAGM